MVRCADCSRLPVCRRRDRMLRRPRGLAGAGRSHDAFVDAGGSVQHPERQRFPPIIGLPFGGISGLAQNPLRAPATCSASPTRSWAAAFIGSRSDGWTPLRIDTSGPSCSMAWRPATTPADLEGARDAAGRQLPGVRPRARPRAAAAAVDQHLRPARRLRRQAAGSRDTLRSRADRTGDARRARQRRLREPDAHARRRAAVHRRPRRRSIQDGEPADVRSRRADANPRVRCAATGASSRRGSSSTPRAGAEPPFTPGFFINGLVELLALNRTTLLALERGYVEIGRRQPARA